MFHLKSNSVERNEGQFVSVMSPVSVESPFFATTTPLPPDRLSITCFLSCPLHPLRSHQLTSCTRCHKSPPGSSSRPPATDILTISPPYMFEPSQCGFITRTSNMHQCTQTSLLNAKNQPTLTIPFFRYYSTVAEPPFPLCSAVLWSYFDFHLLDLHSGKNRNSALYTDVSPSRHKASFCQHE